MQNKKLRAVLLAGILAALSFVLMRFTEFPLIPSANFLKTDLGDIPLLLGAIYLGPGYGVAIAFVKDLLYMLSGGGGGGVLGAFINFVALGTFAFVLGLITRKNKSLPNVLLGLVGGTLAMTITMFYVNMWAVPIFMRQKSVTISHSYLMKYLIYINLPFNLLKGAIDLLLTTVTFAALRKRKKI